MTAAQKTLFVKLRASTHGIYIYGPEVRVARSLVKLKLATLEDDGPMLGLSGRSDGERWSIQLTEKGRLHEVT